MSNGLAISTVSAAFQQRLLEAVSPQVGDVKMRLGPPTAKLSSDGVALVNVHLFRVEPNSHNANTHLATRTSGGAAVAPAQLALNLHYVVSFYGNYEDHEPDRMLAAAMIALEAEPALSRRTVLAAIEASDMLEDSDLLDALARLRVTRQLNTLDDFSKIWSIFYQVPYAISLVYEVAHVVIEEDRPRAVPLPVAQPKIWAAPTPKLRLDSIAAHGPGGDQNGAEPRGLATWGAPIVLRGKGLGQSGLTVFIDDLPVAEAGVAPSQSSQWGAQITVKIGRAHV